jgi:AAA domain-containing protein
VRFTQLEAHHFRAVNRASIEFGPGLNVLYGPNDLGKTTLAAAMRAALLLPADSSAHQAFVSWQSSEPPRVCLGFQKQAEFFRISKSFGSGSAGTSRLESSPDGLVFREDERGRAVDRRLRELLRWGIEAPGGKGGGRGLPESFLSQVLLATQASVAEILERTLSGDRDSSGRERLHEALSALAQDPVFKRVLEAAQAKVELAFTPTGRRKSGQNSPFSGLKEQINTLGQEFERLSHQRRESEEVQQRMLLLSEERLALEEQVAALTQRTARERVAFEQALTQQAVRDRHAAARQRLLDTQAAARELERLEAELLEVQESTEASAENVRRAAEARDQAEARWAAAEGVLAAEVSDLRRSELFAQRAQLEANRSAAQAQLSSVEQLLGLERALLEAERAWQAEGAALEAAEQTALGLKNELGAAHEQLSQVRRLDAACQWREAERSEARARSARDEAAELEREAESLRAGVAEPNDQERLLAELPSSVLAELRRLEGELRVAEARLDVGLAIELKLPVGTELSCALDGSGDSVSVASDEPFRARARNRIVLRLPGEIELSASAGDPELRAELTRVQQRWALSAVPLLELAQAPGIGALSERVELERSRARERQSALSKASSLCQRAAEKRELGADLETWQQRKEQRWRALAEVDPAALQAALAALGAGWEATLQKRMQRADADVSRLSTAFELHAAVLAKLSARVSGQAAAVAAARELRAKALAELGHPERAAPPSLTALLERRAAAEQALVLAQGQIRAFEDAVSARAAEAQQVRDRASAELSSLRQRHEAALAASQNARDQKLTREAQVRERKLHVAALAPEAARLEFERAEAELRALLPLEAVSAEQLAATELSLAAAIGHRDQLLGELRRAEGALGQVGGDVVLERERQTREALERARELELDQEREYDAYRLLTETLRAVENEQGVHLGRALEAPVSERFERLTLGRYGSVGLDAGLGLHGVFVAGQARGYRELSEGTQEQLATILRLCIAEHLGTALLLDDHLAQTHRQRAEWFRGALREAAERIQIIVLTARPEDYLTADELCDAEPTRDSAGGLVRAIDLERVIERASYGSS